MTKLPTPYAAARIAAFLDDHLSWSAWWDKRYGLWRVAEDDPQSELYAESRNADVVIRYISALPRHPLSSQVTALIHHDALQPGQRASAAVVKPVTVML